jgi:endonuclease/exonuclease/phosphatase family metal-dependent hydrolase
MNCHRLARLARTVLFAVAFLAPAAPTSAQGSETEVGEPVGVAVMTFNIRTAEGRDGDDAWSFRKELVAETIRRADPDVLGMQEVLTEQIDFFEDALPQYRWIGVDRGLNGGTGLSEATPIFYRYGVLAPIESGTFWLGNPPRDRFRGRDGGRGGSRIVTWARFHHFETGQQIYVYNTHFTLREGQQQFQSVDMINERVAALPPGSAVIVMGDFNAVAETSTTWQMATSQGLEDAWQIASDRSGPAVTSWGFNAPPESGEERIDWILVGGPVAVSSVATVVHTDGHRYPSDHYPVLATLLIGPS